MAHLLEMDSRHRYTCSCGDATCKGKVFESVTTILGRAVPKNLAWHGQTRGIIGVRGLFKLGRYDVAKMSTEAITEALKRERLTVNDHRDQAATRGTSVHKALEEYATRGTIPVVSQFPEQDRGYVRGLAKFIMEYRPEFLATEVRVISTEHSYAGTFDLLARIDGRPYLIDLKTSKWVYPSSHFPQLEAYEAARREAGEDPTDVRAVLWINSEGDMSLIPSTATFADFLALKASAEVITRLDRSYKRPRKAKT